MTPLEIETAKALGCCSFLTGSWQKRFAREIAFLAANSPERGLSDRQRQYLQIMAWRYRRQMPARLVPASKPANPPPPPPAESFNTTAPEPTQVLKPKARQRVVKSLRRSPIVPARPSAHLGHQPRS